MVGEGAAEDELFIGRDGFGGGGVGDLEGGGVDGGESGVERVGGLEGGLRAVGL